MLKFYKTYSYRTPAVKNAEVKGVKKSLFCQHANYLKKDILTDESYHLHLFSASFLNF